MIRWGKILKNICITAVSKIFQYKVNYLLIHCTLQMLMPGNYEIDAFFNLKEFTKNFCKEDSCCFVNLQ